MKETREDLLDFLHGIAEEIDPEHTMRWDNSIAGEEFASVSLAYVRPGHAQSAMAYGSHAVLNLYGQKLIFAAERVEVRGVGCVVIALAHAGTSALGQPRLVLEGAWRLYGSEDELARWSDDPLEAFASLLDRYAVRLYIEGNELLWMPMMLITLPEPDIAPLDPDADPDDPSPDALEDPMALSKHVMRGLGIQDPTALPEHAFIARFQLGADGRVMVYGSTMIDLDSYSSDVEARR